MKNDNFFSSVRCAVNGYIYAVKNERNLRVDLAISNLICVFAYAYRLDRSGWAVLLTTITVVICAELFNTSVERAVDASVKTYDENAKHAKDVAAAAVIVAAIGAMIVGIALFGDINKIFTAILNLIFSKRAFFGTLILLLLDILFILKFKTKDRGNINER